MKHDHKNQWVFTIFAYFHGFLLSTETEIFSIEKKFGFGQLVKLFPDTQKNIILFHLPGAVAAATAAVPGSPPPSLPLSPTMPRLFLLQGSISEIAKCSKVSRKKSAPVLGIDFIVSASFLCLSPSLFLLPSRQAPMVKSRMLSTGDDLAKKVP